MLSEIYTQNEVHDKASKGCYNKSWVWNGSLPRGDVPNSANELSYLHN